MQGPWSGICVVQLQLPALHCPCAVLSLHTVSGSGPWCVWFVLRLLVCYVSFMWWVQLGFWCAPLPAVVGAQLSASSGLVCRALVALLPLSLMWGLPVAPCCLSVLYSWGSLWRLSQLCSEGAGHSSCFAVTGVGVLGLCHGSPPIVYGSNHLQHEVTV